MVKQISNLIGIILVVMIAFVVGGVEISSQDCQMKGDSNCDSVVSDFELLPYIDNWTRGYVTDFDLLQTIDNWARTPITNEDLLTRGDGSSKVTVTRDLPSVFYPSSTSTIRLSVDLNQSNPPTGVIITERIPTGWTIISSSPRSNVYDIGTGTIKWVLYGQLLSNQNITYAVQVPANATVDNFTGVVRILNSSNPILEFEFVKPTSSSTANRTLPDKASAGSRVNVTIALDVNESSKPSAVIVKDYFPVLWNATVSSPAANSISRIDREIKWILTGEQVFDRVISYMVEIPAGELGNRTFSGEVIYNDPSDNPITVVTEGDSVISVEKQCVVKGDFNCDDKVSDFEILDYVSKWVKGEISDFDLLEAINNWAKG